MRRFYLWALVSSALMVGATSCGDDDDALPGVNPDQPGTATQWLETSRRVRCAAGNDGSGVCTAGKFIVTQEGRFIFSNTAITGQLTVEERASLDAAANAVRDNLDDPFQCEGVAGPGPLVATEAVTLTPLEGGEVVVYEFNQDDGRRCILGSEAEVMALRTILAELMRKYAPGIAPGIPGAYDPCEGKTCGDPCTICSPDDPNCFETAVLKFCTRTGECVPNEPVCAMPSGIPSPSPSPSPSPEPSPIV